MRTLASTPERSIGTRNVKGEPLLATTHIGGTVRVLPGVSSHSPRSCRWTESADERSQDVCEPVLGYCAGCHFSGWRRCHAGCYEPCSPGPGATSRYPS